MALIKCSECGKEISDTSKVCINCGKPLNGETKVEEINGLSLVSLLSGIALFLLYYLGIRRESLIVLIFKSKFPFLIPIIFLIYSIIVFIKSSNKKNRTLTIIGIVFQVLSLIPLMRVWFGF